MKVLMVVSWYTTKDAPVMTAGVFHYEQSMALKPYCDMALYYPYDTELSCDFSAQEEKGLMTYRRNPNRRKLLGKVGIPNVLQAVSDLRRICKEFQPDIIHAHCSIPAGRAAVLFGKLYGYPVVITEHNPMEALCLDNPSAKKHIHTAYRGSRSNICVSSNSMERLQEVFPDCSYQVIYNGIIDPNTMPKDGNQYALPGKVNCCIVAAFYSLDIKGYQFLLPAIKQLKDEGMEIVLHVCGGGDYLEHYQNLAQQLQITDNCIFYGQCDRTKVYSIMSQMDFSISASIYECSGVSVEEAMLLGKPLVVTRSGGANSLVTEDTAIVVDRGSTAPLVEGIRQMIQQKDRFDPAVIRQYAYENFEIDHVSRQYSRLYQAVTENVK